MSDRFLVASYNIHGCVGRDKIRDIQRITSVIRELNTDIIGLQEVDSRVGKGADHMQMDYIAHHVGLNAIAGPAIQRDDGHYGNLLLTNHEVVEVRRWDLSVGKHEPRGALDVDIRIRGHLIRVIITHFGLLRAERRYQAKKLLATLDDYPRHLLIVMGDFNEWFPRSRSLEWLYARLGKTPAPATFPAFFPILPLDRIWVSPAQALLTLEVHNTHVTRICSDHLPLKASIALRT